MNNEPTTERKEKEIYPPDVLNNWLDKNTPQEFYENLKYRVLGQDEELRKAAIMVYGFISSMAKSNFGKLPHFLIEGTSGCGKSTFANALQDLLPCPVVVADGASITPTGYRGTDIADLVSNSEFENFCYCGVLVIDEIDKLMAPSITSEGNNFHLEAMHTLLKLLDGGMLVDRSGNAIDCSRMLVIGMGAFSDLRPKEKRTSTRPIGFAAQAGYAKEEELTSKQEGIAKEAISAYSGSEQLLGRFLTVLHFKSLGRAIFHRMIIQAKNEINSMYGCDFDLSQEQRNQIVSNAMSTEFGARAVKSAVWEAFLSDPEGWVIQKKAPKPKPKTADELWKELLDSAIA